MKKKTIFLLASVAMSAALVGGTFAAWAVTDNADPFSIKVSTGDVTTDQTEYVTLEWGEQQKMGHVANLALNTVRKAGVLDLRANTASTTSPNGTLSYSLAGGEHLLAKLQLKIYEGNLTAGEGGVIAPATLEGKTPLAFTEGSKVITVSKNVANLYTVAVNLGETTAAELAEMTGEQVSITFDWGPGTDIATATTLYATGFAGAPKAYAWTGATQNAAFPGVDMEEVVAGSGVYSVRIPSTLQNVIFSYDDNYEDETNRQQSGDLAISTVFASGNMFTYNASVADVHGTVSTFDPADIKVTAYYVVGDFTNPQWTALEANKMTAKSGTTDEYEIASVTLAAGAKLKVFEKKENLYFGCDSTWEGCGFTLDNDGNLVVTAAGNYKIHIDLTPEGAGNYVDIKKL